MIVDDLKNLKFYTSLHEGFEKVQRFLLENDLNKLDCGKYEIDSDKVFLSLQSYQSKNRENSYPEAHKNYIDIQIVVSGSELIGYSSRDKTVKYIEYDPQKDIEFLKGYVEFLSATPDKFFIFFPQDAHMPSIAANEPENVKKAVFKIKIK